MHNGYIKIYRKIIETAFFKNPVCVQLAILCLVKANHKQQKIILNQKEVIIERGQFVTGLFSLSHEMHASMQKVRTALKILSNCGFLTRKSTNKFSIITIEKYGQYQDVECLSNNQNNKPATNQQQTNNKQITTNNNDKNDKNDKKKELKPFVDTSNEVRLSEKLLAFILEKNPNHKKPDIQSWARHVDLMLRVDKRQVEQIETVIDWCQSDSFWQNNILSTKKLREKFDQLFLKMNNGNGQHQSKYDHNMAVAKRMINKAREEEDKNEPRKRLQSPWDAFDCISGQENE